MRTRRQQLGYPLSLSLTFARALMVLPLILIALARSSGRWVAVILVAGFLTDVYDGVIARHFDVATAGLRRLDSAVDTVFFAGVAACVWRLHPEVVIDNRWLLSIVVGTLLLNHLVEFLKFRREAAYHAWSAKLFALALFASLVGLFASDSAVLVPVALALGVLSHLENFAITMALPRWQHDVKSFRHALGLRKSPSE
jgi:phosphatidylglycerophosphate synthase